MSEAERSLERISGMESRLDETTNRTAELQKQLEAVRKMKENTKSLFQYYGSGDWYDDRERPLPEGFKAGVLSEDSVYDAMTGLRNAAFGMLELGTEILKEWL